MTRRHASPPAASCLLGTCLGFSLTFFVPTLAFGGTSDPTQPPPAWLALKGGAGLAGSTKSTVGTHQLQLLLQSPQQQRALINGELLSAGQAVGDARLRRITRDGVTLAHEDGDIELRAFPAVRKTLRPEFPSLPIPHRARP